MKFGYIHSSKEEQTKALQVLKMTSESVALDELGIGRIRDAFADRLFPGISTLQKHIKYFSLLPQLYKKATEKHYSRSSEVRAEIVRLERIMTENLVKTCPNATGITGSEIIRKQGGNYVKYDPAYIYNSGLLTFEILHSPQIHELIYSASKALHESPKIYKTDDEDTADDAMEKAGFYQFCSFPSVDYDFTKSCSLNLTDDDLDFIKEHIINAEASKGTLLRFLVDTPHFTLPQRFCDFSSNLLPDGIAEIQDLAARFADFIYMIYVRYNYIFSGYEDKELLNEFNNLVEDYLASGTYMDTVLAAVNVRENSCKVFCKEVETCIRENRTGEGGELDLLIINRECRIKGARRKIGNPSYVYNSKNKIHYYRLTYRWETVRRFIDELRKNVNYD